MFLSMKILHYICMSPLSSHHKALMHMAAILMPDHLCQLGLFFVHRIIEQLNAKTASNGSSVENTRILVTFINYTTSIPMQQ